MKISVCLPVYGETRARFTLSLAGLVGYSMSARPELQFQFHLKQGCSRIDKAREQLAEMALRDEAEWLLWLDADQTFPPDTLLRLLAHDQPLVGCHYPRRNERAAISTALQKGRPLQPKNEGIEAVDLMPFGVALIRVDVFRALPRPWFKMPDSGEDGYFCEQACRAGFTPHVDHALSREVGHIAETVLKLP